MLPKFEPNIRQLPRPLVFVRDLEEFDGPILSELRAEGGGLYLEKWCAHEEGTVRTLIVRTEQRAVAEYLAHRISMLSLLVGPSDGVGFIVDRVANTVQAVYMVALSEVPEKYLPRASAFHDESLRPEWEKTPQNFLLDADWDAKLLAEIERLYFDVSAFIFFTSPNVDRLPPSDIFNYDYDGGYPIANAFRRLRTVMPKDVRSKSVGVSANSPGVLTIDAPSFTAEHLLKALSALQHSDKAYENLYAWSRLKPDKADQIPPGAVDQLTRLCESLDIDTKKVLPAMSLDRPAEPIEILTAGKLVAAYYRKLWKLLEPKKGVEFLGVDVRAKLAAPPSLAFEDDDDEWL